MPVKYTIVQVCTGATAGIYVMRSAHRRGRSIVKSGAGITNRAVLLDAYRGRDQQLVGAVEPVIETQVYPVIGVCACCEVLL